MCCNSKPRPKTPRPKLLIPKPKLLTPKAIHDIKKNKREYFMKTLTTLIFILTLSNSSKAAEKEESILIQQTQIENKHNKEKEEHQNQIKLKQEKLMQQATEYSIKQARYQKPNLNQIAAHLDNYLTQTHQSNPFTSYGKEISKLYDDLKKQSIGTAKHHSNLHYILIILKNYPEVLEKMQKEIEENWDNTPYIDSDSRIKTDFELQR